MTSRTRVSVMVFAAVAAVLGPAPAGAQEPDGWTLERLLEHARANEPSLRAARLGVEALEADARQAALRANPRLDLQYRHEPAGMDRQTMVTAALPLELFRRGPRGAAARAETTAAAAAADDFARMVAHDVRLAYSRYLSAIRRVAVFDQLLAEARRTLSLLESRAAAGAIPRLERDQASIDTSRIEADRLAAVGTVETARAELRRSVGLPSGAPLTVQQTLEAAIPWAEIEKTLLAPLDADPIDDRADVRAARAAVKVHEARAEQARSEGRIDVSLLGGYMRMTSGFPQLALGPAGERVPIRGTFDNIVAGAMIDVPLFNRNQGMVAAAEIRASAAEQDVEARRLAVAAEVEAALARLRAASARVRIFTKELRDTARQTVDVVREAYSLGRNSLLEVVTEQKRYLDVELAYTEALAELLEAHAAWHAATGRQP